MTWYTPRFTPVDAIQWTSDNFEAICRFLDAAVYQDGLGLLDNDYGKGDIVRLRSVEDGMSMLKIALPGVTIWVDHGDYLYHDGQRVFVAVMPQRTFERFYERSPEPMDQEAT